MIKAIIFDFFGVLVGDGFDYTYRFAGGDPQADKAFIEQQLEMANRALISTEQFRSNICARLNISAEEWLATVKKTEIPNQQLLDYIELLRQKYKTAILSNVNRGGLERRFTSGELKKYFDVIVASGDVGFIKPEREVYELTAEKLGVSLTECVFIDDRQMYVEPAVEYGMKGIVYKDFRQMKQELEKLLKVRTA